MTYEAKSLSWLLPCRHSQCQPHTHQLWGIPAFHFSNGHLWRISGGCTFTPTPSSRPPDHSTTMGFTCLLLNPAEASTLQPQSLPNLEQVFCSSTHPQVSLAGSPNSSHLPFQVQSCSTAHIVCLHTASSTNPVKHASGQDIPGKFISMQNFYKHTFISDMLQLTHLHDGCSGEW